jgi:chemotaxis protein CheX
MTAYAPPTDDDLREITEQVWSSYLDVDGSRPLMPYPAQDRSHEVTASVSLTGAWQGHVVVACSDPASRNAAAALLGVKLDEVTEADVADAMGELANIIGGNIKSLLPEPCALSLPHVLVGSGASNHWPSVAEVCQLDGSWLGESVTIDVLEQRGRDEVAKVEVR